MKIAKCPKCGYNQQILSQLTMNPAGNQYFVTCGNCDFEFLVDANNVIEK